MLEGDLGDFTLPDILKLLAFTNKTGRLGIVTDDARGRVDLVGGHLRDASADAEHLPLARRLLGRRLLDGAVVKELLGDADALPTDLQLARSLVARDGSSTDAVGEVLHEQALDAVFDLLRWSTGTFRFEADHDAHDVDTPPVLDLSIDDALQEATRRLEAWPQIHERTGPGDAVVHVGRPTETSVEVDADGWQLLGLADGKRTVDELSQLCGRGQFDTRSTLAALLELGVVTIATDGSSAGEDGLLADQALLSQLEASLGGGTHAPPGTDRDQAAEVAVASPEVPPVPEADGDDEPGVQDEPEDQAWPDDALEDAAAAAEHLPAADHPPADVAPWVAAPSAAVHDLPPPPAEPPRIGSELMGSGLPRGNVRGGRLTQDASVDAELVNRLITGVEDL